MSLSMIETQAIGEIANVIYSFLPGKPHPRANQKISFISVATDFGMSIYWMNGSKLPAITTLLLATLEYKRNSFCDLILEIVRRGTIYRNNKKTPITRSEIVKLNTHILSLKFKIPDLWDNKYLNSLDQTISSKNQEVDFITLNNQFKQIQ